MRRYQSLWRTEIQISIDELRHRLRLAEEEADAPLSGAAQAHLEAARQALEHAEEAIREPRRRERLRQWWTGTAVTAGWEYLHEAEAELVELESPDALRASLPALVAWMQEVMPPGGPRKRYEGQLQKFLTGERKPDRTVVRQAYHDVILANNDRHASIRALRNRIVIAIATMLGLLSLVGLLHVADSHFVSLCGLHQAENGQAETRCISDDGKPSGRDVIEVELIGAIGGLLSVAFGLGKSKAVMSRYDPRGSQLLLKPVTGAAVALLGVIFVQSEIFIAPPSNISESVMLAYAGAFGFSQQLLTRMVDKRAGKLLDEPTQGDRPEDG